MKQLIVSLWIVLLGISLLASAQDTLVLTAPIENTPSARSASEVLRQAYGQLGIQITLREYPGLRGLEYSNVGEIDGEASRVAGMEKEYPNLIRIGIPIRVEVMHLFVKRGKEFTVTGWDSIPKDYVFGHKRGTKFAEYAAKEHGLRTEAVSTVEQLFLKLESGRNDVIVTSDQSGLRLLPRLGLQDITRLEPPIHTNYLYHYLNKKHADLVPKITAVLKEMEARGEIQKIREQADAENKP